MKSALLLAAALSLGSAGAFAPSSPLAARPATSLSAKSDDGAEPNGGKALAATSALVAASLLAGVAGAPAAFAADDPSALPSFADSSSVVLAGRSGGRAGGRAAPRAMPRSAPASTSKTVINRTTVVAPPVVVSPGYGYGYGGYGYGYGGGLGLNLGLSAVSAIGNGIREGQQNQAIATERAELNASRERERDMAERIRQLEMMQMQQNGGQAAMMQQQAQPQVIIAQPPVNAQAAPVQP